MLVDNFNRKISYLRMSVTDKCNLRCLYCMPEEGINLLPHEKILSLEDLIFFAKVSAMLGITKIRITGGEPLLRKNIIFLLKNIVNLKGINDVSITTNGVYLEDYVDDLIEAGIKRINVSLDTLKRDKFKFITRRDYFSNVVKGIKKASERGLNPVKVNIVAIKNFNDDEIIDFVKFGIENNLQIRFIEFMPFGIMENLRFISKEEIKEIIEKKFELVENESCSGGPAKMYTIKDTTAKVGFISPMTEHFCNTCNRIRLTCDGGIKTCLFAENIINIFQEIKSHNFEILKHKLIEIVKEKPERHNISLRDYKFKKCQNEMRIIGG